MTSRRGGLAEPWPTPSRAPKPSSAIFFSSSTSISTPSGSSRLRARSTKRLGIDDVGRLGDQLAGEGEAVEQRRAIPPGRLRAVAGADDHHLFQRRLLLAGELGAVEVVAPAARRRAEADPRRRVGREAKPGQVDDEPGLAGGEQAAGEGSADAFVKRLLVAIGAEPDRAAAGARSRRPGRRFRRRRRARARTSAPSAARAARVRAGSPRLASRSESRSSLRDRKGERVGAGGAFGGEADVHGDGETP